MTTKSTRSKPVTLGRDLTPAARRIFSELVREYAITDAGGLRVLHSGLRALDQATAAEARIAKDGQVFVDRFGQPRPHPLLAVARDFRAQWLSALRQLNLSIGDPTRAGRPEGS